jgi:hypothetical protein
MVLVAEGVIVTEISVAELVSGSEAGGSISITPDNGRPVATAG